MFVNNSLTPLLYLQTFVDYVTTRYFKGLIDADNIYQATYDMLLQVTHILLILLNIGILIGRRHIPTFQVRLYTIHQTGQMMYVALVLNYLL